MPLLNILLRSPPPPVCVAVLICCVQPLLTWRLPEKAWPQDGVAWPLSRDDSAVPAEKETGNVPF